MEPKTKILLGVLSAILLVVVLVLFLKYGKNNKEESNEKSKETYQIRENFPQTSNVNLLYTDQNGNLGATSDVGITNLTVFNGSNLKGGVYVDTLNADTIKQGGNVLIPKGSIIMWSGDSNNIPGGWGLCNGTNGTPNLSGRFIVGVGSNGTNTYTAGQKGGSDSVTLNIDEMPSHDHYILSPANIRAGGDNRCDSGSDISCSDQSGLRPTDQTGKNQPHENRPSFFALCYIMKL